MPGYSPLPAPQQNPFQPQQQAGQMVTLPNGQQVTLQQWYQIQQQMQMQQQNPIGLAQSGLFGGGSGGIGSSLFGGGQATTPELSSTAYQSLPGISTQAPEVIGSSAPGAAPITTSGSIATGLPEASILANAQAMGPGPIGLIAAGTYLGGKSIYDGLKGKKDNSIPGIAGRVTAGIATGGLSEAARAIFGHQSTHDYQKEQNTKLGNKIPSFKAFIDTVNANRPNIVDSKFNQTHNVADLGVNDITGANPFFEKYGDKWLGGMSEQERNDIAQQALSNGAVGSHKGLITVDWNKFDQNKPAMPQSIVPLTRPAMIPKAK